MIDSIKAKIEKRKKEKAREKKLVREMEEEERQIEEELKEEFPEPKFSIFEAIDMLKGKSEEDREYESYLTEDEKIKLYENMRTEKRIATIAISIFLVAIVVFSTIFTVYYNTHKSDLLKITQPLLSEYYQEKYNEKIRIQSLEELTYKDEEKNDVNTGIYLLTTKDNKHIMTVNNELIGDDISIGTKKKEVLEYIDQNLQGINSITSSIDLSYKDYYINFNRYIDYINTLPSEMTSEDLINSKKLTVTYKAIYQNYVDDNVVRNLLNNFSDDSSFYFLKQGSGGISNLKIITKTKIIDLDVTAQINKDDNILYLELDRNKNAISTVNVKKYVDSSTKGTSAYKITNPYSISYEYSRKKEDQDKETMFLLRFPAGSINSPTYIELGTSKRNDYYEELPHENYSNIILIEISSYTYVIGDKGVLIGRKVAKNQVLCELGLC